MRILHVINQLSSGGAERLVADLTRKMNGERFDVEILTLSNKGDVYGGDLRTEGYNVYNLLPSKKSIYNIFIVLLKLIIFFRKNHYDLVHVHLFPGMYYISFLKRLHIISCPIIFHEHSTANGRLKYGFIRPVDKFMYSPYSQIICISNAVGKMLENTYGINQSKLVVIPNGIDVKRCKEANAINRKKIDKSITDSDLLLIMVARFNRLKDHKTLLKALSKLPSFYKLILLGEGELESEIKECISSLFLNGRVILCGYKSNVYDYIKASNISVLSSNFEGFGLSCIESMACGVPVVVSDVPGIADVVEDSASKFEVGDVDGLVDEIKKLALNTKLYEQRVSDGQKLAQKYSIDSMALHISELYNQYRRI